MAKRSTKRDEQPRSAEEGLERLAEGRPEGGVTAAEEYRAEHPVPVVPVGEHHQLSTVVPSDVDDDDEEELTDAEKVRRAGADYRRNLRQAVSVHHQLGEIARGQGAYPGEILPLHTSRGQEAMLGANSPGAKEALARGAVDFDANVIRATPQGMSSRYDPNEE